METNALMISSLSPLGGAFQEISSEMGKGNIGIQLENTEEKNVINAIDEQKLDAIFLDYINDLIVRRDLYEIKKSEQSVSKKIASLLEKTKKRIKDDPNVELPEPIFKHVSNFLYSYCAYIVTPHITWSNDDIALEWWTHDGGNITVSILEDGTIIYGIVIDKHLYTRGMCHISNGAFLQGFTFTLARLIEKE